MSAELAFRSRVSAIMEALTTAVVQEICQLMGETYSALRVEMLHKPKIDAVMEKPVNLFNNVSQSAAPTIPGDLPVVGQILNKQEANGIWLEEGAAKDFVSRIPETVRKEPIEPISQSEDSVPWPVWLIKQEEMEPDDEMDSQGNRKWNAETHSAALHIEGESEEEVQSQVSGGSNEFGLQDFKIEFQDSLLPETTEDAAAPIKLKTHSMHALEHSGTTYFQCSLCNEKFQRQSGLARHERHKHGTVKTYCCSVCGKGFTYMKSLNTHELTHSELSTSSALPLDETRKRSVNNDPTDGDAARNMISAILHSRPGGEKVFQEYATSKSLTDSTRRLMVNLVVADMMENHGRTPPSIVRTNYALGIVTLFPYLSDPDSEHGYEQYYDSASGSGYLTWRIKTVGRNTSCKTKQKFYQNGSKAPPPSFAAVEQLSDEQLSVCSAGSDWSAGVLDESQVKKRRRSDEPTDKNAARDMISAILHSKPGGEMVLQEYAKTEGLTESTRRLMVNIVVADMMENYGRTPPSIVRTNYALGIVTLFPYLSDPDSEHGYEKYYDANSGSGYLTWRIKTVGRNTSFKTKDRTKSTYQNGPKIRRSSILATGQLSGVECAEAVTQMKQSTDEALVKEKMKLTFQYRQEVIHDPEKSSNVLDIFPRYLDMPGLINQDFTMLFGEHVSGTFLAKWATFFKPRVIADCKTLPSSEPVEKLLSSAQHKNNGHGWESDLASILLLLHLLPPTSKGPKTGKIPTSQAADHLVKFLTVGTDVKTFLEDVGCEPQPFLLCVGEHKHKLQKFYVVIDQKAIPCQAQTSVAAFDELFKAHYVFSLTYHEALCNFYTFIQTTVYAIDVGKAKESSRVKEIRVRLLNKDT
ncbi:hypothetical protein UPYG_G00046910 [Umbra pygmaea]|uniref:C2H2-type domain-containing protein n=1 Tax=Umbra pygmaea TaxID=75934 RepID=A0ABD0XR58_UMBPY